MSDEEVWQELSTLAAWGLSGHLILSSLQNNYVRASGGRSPVCVTSLAPAPSVLVCSWEASKDNVFSPKFKGESATLSFPLPEICNKKNKISK